MKKTKIKIGLIGCGAIGKSLMIMAQKRFNDSFEITALCDLDQSKAQSLSKVLGCGKVVDFKTLIKTCDLVVEAASAKISFEVACEALLKKRNVLVMSIGGILGKEGKLFEIARRNKKRIFLPSGAICGLDGVKALALAGIDRLTLKTYKPPQALKGASFIEKNKIDLDAIKEEKMIFSGTAQQAVESFPQNINVVAVLSIAAAGLVVPRVEIYASPELKRNVHVIEVESKAARLSIRCENVPSPDNPKTSYLAILSAAAMLSGVSDVVRVGS